MYQIALLMTAKMSIDWTQVATVVLAGVGIVLAVLIVLIFVFSGFGKLVSNLEKSAKGKKTDKTSKNVNTAPVVSPAPVAKAAPAPVVEQGISGEVVAAITAAITASEGSNQFVIRSVKRKDVGSRNPWARAAVNDNTKSF